MLANERLGRDIHRGIPPPTAMRFQKDESAVSPQNREPKASHDGTEDHRARTAGRKVKLSDDTVAALTCPEGRKDMLVTDATLRGFMLRVQASGVRVFLFQYRWGGAVRRLPIGAFGDVTTAKARKIAEGFRGEVAAGRDPAGDRKRQATATLKAERAERAKREEEAFTVAALIETYAEKHVATKRPATQRDVLSRLRLHLAPIKALPAVAIGRREAAKVVDRAEAAGQTTARRVRDYARAMWHWALGKGLLPEGAPNPWMAAPAPGKDVPRERVLNDEELGHVWNAAGTLATPYGPMMRFLLLTLARREEATAMTWGEVAPDLSTWTQPAGRTKNGKPHVVHLTEPTRAILRTLIGAEEGKPLPALPKGDRLVFGSLGNKAISSHSWVKRELDKAIAKARVKAAVEAGEVAPEPVPHWVLHDFRRSGVTWLADGRRGVAPHVADKLLNHTQGTLKGTALIYQKGTFLPERAAALELWASHVTACAAPAPASAAVVSPAALAEARAKRARKATALR